MKTTISILCALLGAGCATTPVEKRGATIEFAGEKLSLAYVETNPMGGVLNEYIREKDSLSSWQVMFAVRYVPDAATPDDAVKRWIVALRTSKTPGAAIQDRPGSTALDRRFGAAVRPPDDSYLEMNEVRFIPNPDGHGVLYYQAASRVNPKDEKELLAAFSKQGFFEKALRTVTIQPVREK